MDMKILNCMRQHDYQTLSRRDCAFMGQSNKNLTFHDLLKKDTLTKPRHNRNDARNEDVDEYAEYAHNDQAMFCGKVIQGTGKDFCLARNPSNSINASFRWTHFSCVRCPCQDDRKRKICAAAAASESRFSFLAFVF